jgi:dTDP-4-amino-4,6-dideoxygalactose transaminase
MKIPFVDLKKQYLTIKAEIDRSIQSVIDESAFIKGRFVSEFEKQYAEKYGVKHCISVANGTDAIFIVLKSLGIGNGDEVITTASSWISTSETITQTGAKPVFVDIEPEYFTIDPKKIEEKITEKTKAVIPVHLYGQPAKIDDIKKICNRNGLHLIEDCAQAHFAEFNAQRVGTFGIAGTFSFFPSKNLGAFGDAGAIITNNDELAEKNRMYANHGALTKHKHLIEGINSRMDGLQAAILTVKLPYIDLWNSQRHKNALMYNEYLLDIDDIETPKIRPNAAHIFHLYVIRANKRDGLMQFLTKKGIEVAIHYPVALPFLPAYNYLSYSPENLPIVFSYQNQILSLPMFPELTREQIIYVAKAIREYYIASKKSVSYH